MLMYTWDECATLWNEEWTTESLVNGCKQKYLYTIFYAALERLAVLTDYTYQGTYFLLTLSDTPTITVDSAGTINVTSTKGDVYDYDAQVIKTYSNEPTKILINIPVYNHIRLFPETILNSIILEDGESNQEEIDINSFININNPAQLFVHNCNFNFDSALFDITDFYTYIPLDRYYFNFLKYPDLMYDDLIDAYWVLETLKEKENL